MKQANLLDDDAYGPGFIENWARKSGRWPVIGVDEAGRGCLAGPVVAAAVCLRDDADVPGLTDSKLLTPKTRGALYGLVLEQAVAWSIQRVFEDEIDRTNILAATLKAMAAAVEEVCRTVEAGIVIVDGNQPIPSLKQNQRPWVKGDRLSTNCAAASILAKVDRDRFMEDMDSKWPGYGFARHKGYGTKEHMAALERLGPCPIHRKTFSPVKVLLGK